MTPLQEQRLLGQLKALRDAPLREGFEQRLLERLREEAPDTGRSTAGSASKRGRGKLILLAAIFVPFAAAASELALRAIESARGNAQLAADEPIVIKQSYTPRYNAMLEPGIAKVFAATEPKAASADPREQRQVLGAARRQAITSQVQRAEVATSGANAAGTPAASPATANDAHIERLAPNWNRAGNTSSGAAAAPEHGERSVRLAPAALPRGVERARERNGELQAAERRGSTAGAERNQNRERVRQGQ